MAIYGTSIKIRRNDRLIAFGGGITQDIVAFIASIIAEAANFGGT